MTGDPLEDFEEQIQMCREHLAGSDDRDSLEPLFARLLLVSAYGAYERTIRDAVDQRAKNASDKKFLQYLGKATQRYRMPFDSIPTYRLRKPKGPHILDIPISKKVEDAYEKISEARHIVAHGGNVDITLEWIQEMHDMAKRVPLAFADALQQMPNHTRVE